MTKPIASVSTLVLGLVLGLGLGLGATSCTSKREHCWYAEGDATCEAEFGAGYFCVAEDCEGFDQNLGCVSEMPSEECHAPNGMDDGSSESESESSTDATTETMESTDADPTDTDTTTGGCMQDAECMDPSAPICVDEACVGCGEGTDGACKQADPSLPVCDVGSGACVQCLAGGDVSACGGTTPVCDGETNTCVGCKWHDECPDTACRMATGECFLGPVIDAMNANQLDAAISEIAALDPPIGVIHLQASSEVNSVMVPAGVVVAILGEGSESQWQGNNGTPALTIAAGAEVYLEDLSIANTANMGGWGILANGALWLDRSAVVNNDSGGVRVVNTSTVIRNSFVGGSINDVAAIDVQGGTATISFTTIGAGFGTSAALLCSNNSTVTVSNSLLVSRGDLDVVQCPSANITHSALEQQQLGANVVLGVLDPPWFTNYANGDFHLSGTHPPEIDTAASWQPNDPLVDIDGDPRPQAPSPTAAGADLPVP